MSATNSRRNPPSLDSFLSLSKKSHDTALRGKLRHSRQSSQRKSRRSSIMSSLDKFLDGGDDLTQATEFTTGSQSMLNQSMSSHGMMNSVSSMTIEESCRSSEDHHHVQPQQHGRYRRRGSVTKFSLEEDDDKSVGSHSVQCDALVSAVQSLDSSHNNDDDHLRPHFKRERSHRRGSVTKFSLEMQLNNVSGHSKNHHHHDDVSVGCHSVKSEIVGRPPRATRLTKQKSKRNSGTKIGGLMSLGEHLIGGRKKPQHEESDDCISVQSDVHLMHRHSSHEGLPPRGGSGRGRYGRRGSVTKFSLDSDSAHSLKSLENNKPPLVAQDSDRSMGDCSFAEESSVVEVPDQSGGSRQRYRRRGSVTKFSLEETVVDLVKCSSHSTDTTDTFSSIDEGADLYGYGNATNDNPDKGARPARNERHRRRGSVTRYSLEPQEQAQIDEVKKSKKSSKSSVPKPPRAPRRSSTIKY